MLEQLPTVQLADILSSIVKASYPERLAILHSVSLEERFDKALPLLQRQIDGLKLVQDKKGKTKDMDTGIKPKVRLQYFFFGVGGSSLF
jgi:ATP-dependent Lon protease